MCGSSKSYTPPPPPPPMPAQAPPQMAILASPEGEAGSVKRAIKAGRGRSDLRIDRTQSAAGGVGSGMNIPL